MLIVDMLAGLALGALSGMGVGGGGLLVIYLTLVRDAAQNQAQGLNLYFFIFASAAALFVHMTKRKINFTAVLLCTFPGVLAAWAGSLAAASAKPEVLRKLFGGMLIAAGGAALLKMWTSRRRRAGEKNQKVQKNR